MQAGGSAPEQFAPKVSTGVYNEQDASYWLTDFNGSEEKDVQGLKVNPGGSAVFNMSDMANTCGLGNDKADRYKAVDKSFLNSMILQPS